MNSPLHVPTRRLFLASAASSTILPFWTVKGAFAEELTRTPAQTEGPFYPNKLPLDTDNDLLIINDNITPGIGEITHLTGKILDARGNPVKNALVEIWQCDANGVYLHTGDSDGKKDKQDKNFQGFGRFMTGSTGEYYFRTIKPVPVSRPHAAHPLQGQEGAEGTADDAALHQGPPRQPEGRHLAERSRRQRAQRHHRRFPEDEELEARRACRPTS